jgi:hypothetical protein
MLSSSFTGRLVEQKLMLSFNFWPQVLAELLFQAGRGLGQGPEQDQLDSGANIIKHFTAVIYYFVDKLECLSMSSLFSIV